MKNKKITSKKPSVFTKLTVHMNYGTRTHNLCSVINNGAVKTCQCSVGTDCILNTIYGLGEAYLVLKKRNSHSTHVKQHIDVTFKYTRQ